MRKILVANTRNQKSYTFEADVNTLGEVKNLMASYEVPFDGLSFTEGISKLSLLDNASPLPVNTRTVTYNGQQYDTVLLLTNTSKNISSGAEETRKEAYSIIKELDLAEDIKRAYGRNYTQVSTVALWDYIKNNTEEVDVDTEEEEEEKFPEVDEDEEPVEVSMTDCLVENIYDNIKILVKVGIFGVKEMESLNEMVEELFNMTKELEAQSMQAVEKDFTEDDMRSLMAQM